MARHTESKRFMPGNDLGTYRGQMKHGAGVEHVKDALHVDKNPLRKVVAPHARTASVGTDGGAKPTTHPCDDCDNAGINAHTNAQMQASGSPRLTNRPDQIVASGIKIN
jgi:hypothetical protein